MMTHVNDRSSQQKDRDVSKGRHVVGLNGVLACAIVGVILRQVLSQGLIPTKMSVSHMFSVDLATPLPTTKVPAASKDFFVGRWLVRQAVSQGGYAEAIIDYEPNNRFSGDMTFATGHCRLRNVTGQWSVEFMSETRFVLMCVFDSGRIWRGTFNGIDANRIENTDANYAANRIC